MTYNPTRKYTFTVTKETIDRAVRDKGGHCMTAETIKLALPNVARVFVDKNVICWSIPTEDIRLTYLAPPAVSKSIVDYTAARNVKPFTFTIANPYIAPIRHVAFKRSAAIKPVATKTGPKKELVRVFGQHQLRTRKP